MHSTTVTVRGRNQRLRMLVALPAAAALMFGVAACGKSEEDKGQSANAAAASDTSGEPGAGGAPATDEHGNPVAGAANGAQGGAAAGGNGAPGAPGAVVPAGNNPGGAGKPEDAPHLSNGDLLLTAEDFPGMQFQIVSPEQTAQAMQQVQAMAKAMTFTPPECADSTNVASQLPEGTAMANIVDGNGAVAYTVGVLGTGVNTTEFADQNNRCSNVTMSGSGISGTTQTTQVPGPAINGANVQAFDVKSTSRVDALNQEQAQSVANYQITTRGITFRVAATQLQDKLGDDVRTKLNDIANRQAEKIKNA